MSNIKICSSTIAYVKFKKYMWHPKIFLCLLIASLLNQMQSKICRNIFKHVRQCSYIFETGSGCRIGSFRMCQDTPKAILTTKRESEQYPFTVAILYVGDQVLVATIGRKNGQIIIWPDKLQRFIHHKVSQVNHVVTRLVSNPDYTINRSCQGVILAVIIIE